MSPAPREPVGPVRRRVAGQRARTTPSAPAPEPAVLGERARVRFTKTPRAAAPAPPARTAPPEDAGARPGGRTWWRSRWVLVVLAVLAALAVAAALALVVLDRRAQQVSDARTAATETARTSAETILSYDHTTLDEDFAAALALSTGEFAEQYATTSENVVRETATDTEAVVEAQTVAAGVVRADANRVVVLVFVNQTTTSNRLDAPQTDLNRVRMTLVNVDGRWLVEGLDAL